MMKKRKKEICNVGKKRGREYNEKRKN